MLFKISNIKKYIKSPLLHSAGIYTMTNILNRAIPFLLLPVLTRYLSPEDYGIVVMFSVVVGIVSVFTGLNIHGAIGRQYFERDKINFPQYITNCLYIFAISSFFVALILWFFSGHISRFTLIPEGWLWAVWVVSVGQFITIVNLTLWQVQVKPLPYGIYKILMTIGNLGLSVLFVVFLAMKWQGRILAQVLSIGAFSFLSFLILKKNRWLEKGYKNDYIKDALKFGVPLIPHTIGAIAIVMTDKFLITNMIGIGDTGVYTVGAQIGMIIALAEDSFNRAWVPWLYGKLGRNDFEGKIKIVKITYLYNILIILAALLLGLGAPRFLDIFVGKDFRGAGIYVLWIALGYAFSGMYKMVAGYIFYVKKTYILAWITFITAVINVFLSYYLIKLNGALGAAQGTMLAFLFSYIFTWILSSKVYKMPWNLKIK